MQKERENLKGYQVLLKKRNRTKLKSEKYHDVKWQKGLSLYTLLLPLHDSDVDNEATRENALFNFLIIFEVLSLFSDYVCSVKKPQISTFLAFKISGDTEKHQELSQN